MVEKDATKHALTVAKTLGENVMDILQERAAKRGFGNLQAEQRVAQDGDTVLYKFTREANPESEALWVGQSVDGTIVFEPTDIAEAANAPIPLAEREPTQAPQHAASAQNRGQDKNQRGIQQRAGRSKADQENDGDAELDD
jgi:hypothetical protein